MGVLKNKQDYTWVFAEIKSYTWVFLEINRVTHGCSQKYTVIIYTWMVHKIDS